jgi:uncharacterized OB-fold protein
MAEDAMPGKLPRLTVPATAPDPVVHPETAPHWSGLADGELRVQRCARCGTHRFPLAAVCYRCRSFEHSWGRIAGDGRVAVAALVHRATGDPAWSAHAPFLSGIVDVEHGLRLPGRIFCTCGEAGRRGTAVRAVVVETPDRVAVHAFAHNCITVDDRGTT